MFTFFIWPQWREGDEEPECSWRDFYRLNPAVPTDYATVANALTAVTSTVTVTTTKNQTAELPSHTIWLRPQEHRLQESLVIEAVEANITLETMKPSMDDPTNASTGRRHPLASLLLQTRRRNKPLVHIATGKVTLRRLRLGHYCGGFNLWNGNAAVQIQPLPPPPAEDQEHEPVPDMSRLPTATFHEVEVISHSGRGVVINDGGSIAISHSYIHDCAATGIYVGSNQCDLTMDHSDVISNGHGNQLAASVRATGVSRGHSGFYLENGNATLTECNITNNSSCGISVSSPTSRLTMSYTDVVANGHSNQVEAATGSQQWGIKNNIARTGLVKVRSRLGLQCCIGSSSSPVSGRRRSNSTARQSTGNGGNNADERAAAVVVEDEDDFDDDDLDHLQDSFVVAEENIRFGELIEV